MAIDTDKFPTSQQESIATAIAICDDENAHLITNMIEVELFDDPYKDIVARSVEHRRQFKKPPGTGHIDDLFTHIFENRDHKLFKLYDHTLRRMVAQSEQLDTAYVLETVSGFIHTRRVRAGLTQAVELFQKGGEGFIGDIEGVARKILQIRDERKDYGFSLGEGRALGFLDRDTNEYCNLGIPELDERGVVPTKGEVLAFLSPPNRGKSLFCTHCGKYALLKGWKAVHYTLENSDVMTAQRYFMTLFNGVRRSGSYHYTVFDKDSTQVDIRTESLMPDFIIERVDTATAFLSAKQKDWGPRLNNLRIRRFPSGRLSFEMLEQDLDELALVHKFKPDLLIIDMPQLMKLPRRDKDYTALDELVTNIRGLCVDRNMAAVLPQQGNRSSNTSKNVQAQHGSGSFGIFGIADNLITYSQTASEAERGLARLYSQKVRNDRARMTLMISQHYDSGQFCMDSYPMTSQLRDKVKEFIGYKEGEADEDDDEFEEPKIRRGGR